jgi:hypothetical protein
MFKKLLLFAVVLTLSSMTLAQRKTQREALDEQPSAVGNATATCEVTFSSGTGTNATQFCVTANGNIAQFSVDGLEMIAVGAIGEGYALCDVSSSIAYYDYAYEDSGNWGSPTFSQSGNIVTITRLTSDGIWQLKQTITNVPATTTAPASAKVSMALKNLSGVSRYAILWRYADVDADGDITGNDFDFTSQTAYGLEPGFGRGLGITNNTFNLKFPVDQNSYVQAGYAGPAPCSTYGNVAVQPFHNDGSIVQFWYFLAQHNVANTVVSTYKPI